MNDMDLATYVSDPNTTEKHKTAVNACAKVFLQRCASAAPSTIMKDGNLLLKVMIEDYVA